MYNCPRCGYITEKKSSIKKHLSLKKLCKLNKLDVVPIQYENIILRDIKTTDLIKKIKKIKELEIELEKIKNENKELKAELEKINNGTENYDPGYIYVMHNEQFGENVYKIGCSKNPNVRIKDFRTSYINPPILKYLSNKVYNKLETEKIVFEKLKNYRIKNNREFFNIELKEIINIIESLTM